MRPMIVLVGLLIAWALAVRWFDVPSFMLVSPEVALLTLFEKPLYFARHAWVTGQEILLGALLGGSLGVSFGLFLARFERIEPWVWPIIVALQAIPVFAVGPLLVLWMGYSIWMRATMAALIVFFPVAVSTRSAFLPLAQEWRLLILSFGARPLAAWWYLRLPFAFQVLAPGLLVAMTAAPLGAIVGEWIGSNEGLGQVMLKANHDLETDVMVAALMLLCFQAYAMFWATRWLINRLGWWFQPNAFSNQASSEAPT